MVFQNYKTADYAQSTLAGSISSGATSMQVDTGDGALFPSTGDFFITLEAFTLNAQETETITKREQVKVTARTSDTMTIVRGVNDTTAQAFDAGDRVSLYLVAENLDDINTEVARLETDKLDNNELRTGLGASKILTTNGSGVETELAFSGDATQTLLGDGTRGASQTDINGQTLENGTLASGDEIIYYDASAGVNRKRNATATTSREGLVELATSADAASGTAGKVMTADLSKAQYETLTSTVTGVSGTTTIAHGLGRAPKQLIVYGYADNNASRPFHGIRQASNDKSIQILNSGQSYSDSFIGYSGTATATVSSIDATNINLSRSGSGDNLDYTIFCLA